MKLFTFTATSPALALQKAQRACGRDALVVSTKQIKKKSLSQDALYELVIAVEDHIEVKKEENKPKQKPIFDDEILDNISQTAKQLSRLEKLTDPIDKPRSAFEEVKLEIKNDEFKQIKDEIGTKYALGRKTAYR